MANIPNPKPLNSEHPQAKALGKNKFNKKNPSVAPPPVDVGPTGTPGLTGARDIPGPPSPDGSTGTPPTAEQFAALAAPPKLVAAKAPPVPKDPAPGKDKSYFELTIKLVGSEEPPFTVETPLTGNGAADKHNATAIARKKFPGRAMTIVTSRIYVKTENALSEIAPGSTLSSLFGASGEVTGDLIEVGKAVHDGSRGAIFLRNLKTHVGLAFRPALGGLVLFSNRIISNRLASELPMIVSEILGNNAREIVIFLKS